MQAGKPSATAIAVHELVHSGDLTAAQAALLLELRRLHAWRRRPWWDRLITRLLGGGP